MTPSLIVRSLLALFVCVSMILLTVTRVSPPSVSAIDAAINNESASGPVLPTPIPGVRRTIDHSSSAAAATATPRPVVIASGLESASFPDVPGYIFFTDPNHNLQFVTGQHAHKAFTGDGASVAPAFSPGGHLLAWVTFRRSYSDVNVTALRFGQGGAVIPISTTTLTQNQAPPPSLQRYQSSGYDPRYEWWANKPSWLPDGQHLLYLSDRPGFDPTNLADAQMAVWEQGLTDPVTNAVQLSTPAIGTGGDDSAQWRPGDASTFLYVNYDSSAQDNALNQGVIEAAAAVTATAPTTAPIDLTPQGVEEFHPAWSPDGRYIAFDEATAHNTSNLLLMPFHAPGNPNDYRRAITVVTGAPFVAQPFWSPDGKYLGYLVGANGAFSLVIRRAYLDRTPVRFGPPETIVQAGAISADYRPTWGM